MKMLFITIFSQKSFLHLRSSCEKQEPFTISLFRLVIDFLTPDDFRALLVPQLIVIWELQKNVMLRALEESTTLSLGCIEERVRRMVSFFHFFSFLFSLCPSESIVL